MSLFGVSDTDFWVLEPCPPLDLAPETLLQGKKFSYCILLLVNFLILLKSATVVVRTTLSVKKESAEMATRFRGPDSEIFQGPSRS